MNVEELSENLKQIQKQLDEVLVIVKELQGQKRQRAAAKKAAKAKPSPLTEEEITKYKEQFNVLYDRWLGGDEVNVQAELENFDADELRKFADANNLNVTSKTPKPKCLHLIAARFREKKQLTKETPRRENSKIEETTQQNHPADPE